MDPAAERRVRRLQHEIDERDETIRLLNEALSKALDEIELVEAAFRGGADVIDVKEPANAAAYKANADALQSRLAALAKEFERDLRPVDGQSGVPVDFARRPLWLLKGVDRSGRNDFSVGHPH